MKSQLRQTRVDCHVRLYKRFLLDCDHEIIAAKSLKEKDRTYCHICKKYTKVLKETT